MNDVGDTNLYIKERESIGMGAILLLLNIFLCLYSIHSIEMYYYHRAGCCCFFFTLSINLFS